MTVKLPPLVVIAWLIATGAVVMVLRVTFKALVAAVIELLMVIVELAVNNRVTPVFVGLALSALARVMVPTSPLLVPPAVLISIVELIAAALMAVTRVATLMVETLGAAVFDVNTPPAFAVLESVVLMTILVGSSSQ